MQLNEEFIRDFKIPDNVDLLVEIPAVYSYKLFLERLVTSLFYQFYYISVAADDDSNGRIIGKNDDDALFVTTVEAALILDFFFFVLHMEFERTSC